MGCRRLLPFLLAAFVPAACSGKREKEEEAPRPPAATAEAPAFTWPVPAGWRSETIRFPLEFAPDIPHRGVEELRFAPGFFDPAAAGYWAYAFAWVVTGEEPLDTATLGRELTTYFRGLTAAVAAGKKELPAPDLARIEARIRSDGRGTVRTFDAFGDGRQIDLDIAVTVKPCGAGKAVLVSAARRGQSSLSPSVEEVAGAFRCDPEPR